MIWRHFYCLINNKVSVKDMRKHCLIQKKIRLIAYASLLIVFPLCATGAAKALSDADMGDVSAESGDILNVMGATSSGGNSIELSGSSGTQSDNTVYMKYDQQLESTAGDTLKPSNDNIAYIETDQPIESTVDHTLAPSYSNAKDVISTFKISERSDGKLGSSTIFFDEKDSNIEASSSDNILLINQNVRIQAVQIHQVRSAPSAAVRGSYALQDIHVTSNVSIINR